MFAARLVRVNGPAGSLRVVLKNSRASISTKTWIQTSPYLRCFRSRTKPTTAHSFHSRWLIPERPRQQWSREWQQQKRNEYHTYRNARPLLSPETFKSPSFRWIVGLSVGGAAVFYFTHIETVPVSGRKRFNCFSQESAEAEGETAYRQILEQEQSEGKILGKRDPRTVMVQRVMSRLIEGGELGTGTAEGKPPGWEINVIHDDSNLNAFVLPGGKVFVFSGILPVCRNDSGLAAVLGHEIAHNLCGHATEQMSSLLIIKPILWGLMYLDYYFTGSPSGFGRWLGSIVLDLGVMKPSNRQQESEADFVGLLLMAQSCYDPKEAIGFWERMEKVQKGAPPEWLSTHPSNEHRVQRLTDWLPKAEETRSSSGCSVTMGYADEFKQAVQGTLVGSILG